MLMLRRRFKTSRNARLLYPMTSGPGDVAASALSGSNHLVAGSADKMLGHMVHGDLRPWEDSAPRRKQIPHCTGHVPPREGGSPLR